MCNNSLGDNYYREYSKCGNLLQFFPKSFALIFRGSYLRVIASQSRILLSFIEFVNPGASPVKN